MRVILLEKIQKLGDLGSLVNVKAGYARNFLIPQSKAKPATSANLAEFETLKKELQAKAASEFAQAQAKAATMNDIICSIQANAGNGGKLFGSIHTSEIVTNLHAQGYDVEKRDIIMTSAIHELGEYEVSVTLHADISVTVKVVVEASDESM